jgi:hypothetical protein
MRTGVTDWARLHQILQRLQDLGIAKRHLNDPQHQTAIFLSIRIILRTLLSTTEKLPDNVRVAFRERNTIPILALDGQANALIGKRVFFVGLLLPIHALNPAPQIIDDLRALGRHDDFRRFGFFVFLRRGCRGRRGGIAERFTQFRLPFDRQAVGQNFKRSHIFLPWEILKMCYACQKLIS